MKSKVYKIYVNNIPVNVSKEIYQVYWKSVEHEKYQRKRDENNPSLDQIENGYSMSFVECKYLENTNPTKDAVDKILLQDAIQKALSELQKQERELILNIYYYQQTEQEIAGKEHVQQSTVARRKKRILNKLKKILSKME